MQKTTYSLRASTPRRSLISTQKVVCCHNNGKQVELIIINVAAAAAASFLFLLPLSLLRIKAHTRPAAHP